ncbi:ATP-binding protein [Mesorhizobium sp.]|uniref:PAS domain-containing sensor histidine kinase n=1 Tax=Mesorhizobium sp. TaxID=1871066 RepID=UPI000FE7CE69|nr:ATP-binding protein [Mesorhizobium sp.]RWC58458.1 MAG: PAS domain-containing sensor histidine kinase [Mesorhizobium sp.]RWC64943.1 MAG: PAS domain-containing sensor histidine kinase [Mesorhizobium sp.]
MSHSAYRLAAASLALCIFLFDMLSPLEGAVAVLYVLVVLIAARTSWRKDVFAAAAGAIVLTLVAYAISHGFENYGSPALRALVSIAAIGITTMLALQNQAATATLAAQARLLNLSHDMIYVRDTEGVIDFWNDAAEQVYGWSTTEAVGRVADELLRTKYPTERATVEAALLQNGRWEGVLEQETRSGVRLVLDSRWAVQQDRLAKPVGVLEIHTDITERQAAHAALVKSERRYRRMFDSSRIGVLKEDWSAVRRELESVQEKGIPVSDYLAGNPDFLDRARRLVRIVDVNPALLSMVFVEDPKHFLTTADDILSATDRAFAGALAAFARGDAFYEGETEMVGRDGEVIPVLFAITFPASADDGDNVLIYVVDITERRHAQDAIQQAHAELAHAARVATLGELTASIAHEVSQPLMAIVTNGEAGMRWLRRDPPNLEEVETALGRAVAEGRRASDIVKRIRAFLKKAPSHRGELVLSVLVEDATALVQRELARANVQLQVDIQAGIPNVRGDRIQLQQVLVNLMINAAHAMSAQTGPRLLFIGVVQNSSKSVEITVRDTGPGVSEEHLQRLFEPFFSTKRDGMGMGLAICRTTVQAHGGRLAIESQPGMGATFRVTLPVTDGSAAG